ncbi:unnamed protein product [Rotaria socialis]|uniref:TIR domain-containing protein n=3 Tax=Rotaria socialis TaxID=392032 RepID=A0A820U6U5_9BILA|nr:unnamed protein product [Rotaria socialis]CAF4480419.1 unnamed protein product [Rotaria socialis]
MSASVELLREKGTTLSNDQLNACLNGIMHDLTVVKDANNQQTFIEMLTSVIRVLTPMDPPTSYSNHPLIINVLRDSFIDFLKQERNETVEPVLKELSDFFQQRAASSLKANNDTRQMLTDALVVFLAGTVSTYTFVAFCNLSDSLDSTKTPLDYSLHVLLHTLENCKNGNDTVTRLDVIIDCVCSSTFINTFRSLHSNEDNLTENQTLLLIDCVTNVYQYNNLDTVTYLMKSIASRMLPKYAQLLHEFVPPRKPTHIKVLHHFLKMLQFLAIDNDTRHEFADDHALMIDSLLAILQDDFLQEKINDSDTNGLIDNTTSYFFFITLESDLLPLIKTKPNVAKCMLKLTTAKSDVTQLNAYRTLAIIMTEDELKSLAEPEKITTVFIRHLNYSIDVIQQRRRLENLLLCLKSLVQHEQIRDEFAKSGSGLPLLIRCATESKFDSTVVKQRSLELLLVMTFNKQAENAIRSNAKFIAHIEILSHSEEVGLQRVAESVLWKLANKDPIETDTQEKKKQNESDENTSRNKNNGDAPSTNNQHEYDIMISYSHQDKELVYQIGKRLEEDNFRIWLDRDNMYGSPTRAMAHAIENTDFVFICMSDSYKKSGYCEMEAHYAYQKQRRVIPLIVKGPYHADGWLGLLTTNKMYIDFHKVSNFDEAYSKIIQEISRHRGKSIPTMSTPVGNHGPAPHSVDIKPATVVTAPLPPRTLSHTLTLWSEDDVKYFFQIKQLQAMLPICAGMDGSTLSGLYTMCRTNSNAMYDSLKAELTESNSKILPIVTYLKFLEEVKKYVPITPGSANVASVVCNLM